MTTAKKATATRAATSSLASPRKKVSARPTAAAQRKPASRPAAPPEPSTREQVDLFGVGTVPPQEAQQEPLWSLPAVDDDEEFELEDEDDEEPM